MLVMGLTPISWQELEPDVPIAGEHTYADLTAINAQCDELHEHGWKVQMTLLTDCTWGMELDGAAVKQVVPAHIGDWADVCAFVVTNCNIDYLQIENAPHKKWALTPAGEDGLTDVLDVGYAAAKGANPDVLVMWGGLDLGNVFLVDTAFEEYIATLSGAEQAEFATWLNGVNAEKTLCERVFELTGLHSGGFDICALHLNGRPDAAGLTYNWARSQMISHGLTGEVWADGAASGMTAGKWFHSTAEQTLMQLVTEEPLVPPPFPAPNIAAVIEYAGLQHAGNWIKKACYAFAAGTQVVMPSTDQDWPGYEAEGGP